MLVLLSNRVEKLVVLLICLILHGGVVGGVFTAFGVPFLSSLNVAKSVVFLFTGLFFPIFILLFLRKNKAFYKAEFFIVIVFPVVSLLVMIVQVFFHYDLQGEVSNGNSQTAIEYYFPIIIKSCSLFVLGFFILKLAELNKLVQFLLWLCVSFVIYSFVRFSSLSLDYEAMIDPTDRAFTLYISDAFSILSLLFLFTLNSFSIRLLIVLLSSCSIFFLGSRTGALGFLISYFSFCFFYENNSRSIFSSLIVIVAMAVLYILLLNSDISGSAIRFIDMSSNDSSIYGRSQIMQAGLTAIFNNPLIGDFGGQLHASHDEHGARWGAYIHNILSYWRQFGLLCFIPIIFFTLIPLFYMTFDLTYRQSSCFKPAMILILYIVIVSFFSRSFAYGWIFLIPGIYYSMNRMVYKL